MAVAVPRKLWLTLVTEVDPCSMSSASGVLEMLIAVHWSAYYLPPIFINESLVSESSPSPSAKSDD